MRRIVVVSLFSLLLVPAALVLQPGEASACSCMAAPSPVAAAQASHAVFTGKVVSVTDVKGQYDIPRKEFKFTVARTFKGQLDAEVIVTTSDNSAACGRTYGEVGSEWLVYAGVDSMGGLDDNLCSRSMILADATNDIAELEAHLDELDDEPTPEPDQPGPADPEPEPIEPATGGEEPEPTAPSGRCSVTDESPIGGLAGLVMLGLGLGLTRNSRRRKV